MNGCGDWAVGSGSARVVSWKAWLTGPAPAPTGYAAAIAPAT